MRTPETSAGQLAGRSAPARALLLINRLSRSGGAHVDAALGRLREHRIALIEHTLDTPTRIPGLIQRHREDVDCVIVGGGDGSMNAAAQALAHTGLPLGVLPMGTANDLARTLKIPADIGQAVDVIAQGRVHRIDLGSVNGRCFFNVANIGLGAEVVQHLSPDAKRRWGVASYLRGVLRALGEFHPFRADIVCDGRRRRVRSIQIAVGNGRHYGGGMTIAEQASIDDHRFFLYSITPMRLWEWFRLAPALRSGQFGAHHPVELEQGRHIEILTRRPMPVTADGEPATCTPARFRILPAAIGVFVPAGYFDDKQEATHAA